MGCSWCCQPYHILNDDDDFKSLQAKIKMIDSLDKKWTLNESKTSFIRVSYNKYISTYFYFYSFNSITLNVYI